MERDDRGGKVGDEGVNFEVKLRRVNDVDLVR